jgi:hypothetical protein
VIQIEIATHPNGTVQVINASAIMNSAQIGVCLKRLWSFSERLKQAAPRCLAFLRSLDLALRHGALMSPPLEECT